MKKCRFQKIVTKSTVQNKWIWMANYTMRQVMLRAEYHNYVFNQLIYLYLKINIVSQEILY